MRAFLVALPVVLCLAASAALAETKVTISKTHLCCPQCLSAVEATLKDVAGVKHKSSQEAKTIEITADSDEAAQTAVDALAGAGFYGAIDSDQIKFKDIAVPQGEVERLEVAGVHNCCGACTQAIKKAIGAVEGTQANTVKPKAESFVVEGKYSAEKLVKSLLDAGFYMKLKQ